MAAAGSKFVDRLIWNPWAPLVFGSVMLVLDCVLGPHLRFPAAFTIPVAWLAWQQSRVQSIVAAIIMPLAALWYHWAWYDHSDTLMYGVINCSMQVLVLLLISVLVYKVARNQQILEREVRVLSGFLPVCRFCNKIKDKSGKWHGMEEYISKNSEAKMTRSFCPDCGREHYGEISELEL